ncbi:HAMP domain-containing sensor histidine kinase [soil metagenome]
MRTVRRPLRSVRSRILATMLALAAVGMTLAGGAAYAIQRERTLVQIDERLSDAVDDAAFIATDSAAPDLEAALTALVQRLRPASGEGTFALVDGTRAIVPGGEVPLHPERDAAFVARVLLETSGGDVVRGTAQVGDAPLRYVAIPVTVGSNAGLFVVVTDLAAELSPLNDAFATFALVAVVALVAVGLVGWVVAGRLLAPIRRLRETAARITASDPSERIEVVGTDDVSELTVTVNDMLDRLDGALQGQRRLLDDVGHELKTPITIVRGHLEVMSPDDPADVTATRALALDELDRMAGLVRDIAELSDLHRPLRIAPEPTPIAALTQTVRLKAAALSSAHSWTVTRAADVTAVLDPERLTQALLQLATNAVTHGPAGGEIRIASEIRDARLVFTVSDDGPGVEGAAATEVFARFARGQSGGRGTQGSGLGLAIVAAIAVAHGGTASAQGSTFTIDLPLIEVVR